MQFMEKDNLLYIDREEVDKEHSSFILNNNGILWDYGGFKYEYKMTEDKVKSFLNILRRCKYNYLKMQWDEEGETMFESYSRREAEA